MLFPVVFGISYMSESLLVGNGPKEAHKDGNDSDREAFKSLGSVYLHNRC